MTSLPVNYSPKMVDLQMDGSKVLLSLTTGFLTLAAAGLRYLYEQHDLPHWARLTVSATFVLGALAAGAWILCMGAIVVAAKAFDLPSPPADASEITSHLNSRWALAVRSGTAALVLFFLSLATYCTTIALLFLVAHN